MAKPKQDDPEQSRRFLELAQEREAEGDEAKLAKAVKKLAPHHGGSRKPKRSARKG
jgi:hypothetical protein